MVNIKDVALACNVSIATASRALRDTGYVSSEKKSMIKSTAEKMGYIVDINAQVLKKGKSNTIGIIISDIGNYFYNLVLEHLIIEFRRYNYKVITSYSFEDSEIERDNLINLLSNKVDAIIFTPISNKNRDLIDLIIRRGIPVLQFLRQAYEDIDAICVDDGYGSYLATKHLLDKGYRDIMLLSVKLDFTPSRSKGYIKAYEDSNLTVNQDLIQRFPLGHSIQENLKNLIQKHHPQAIIAGTNTFGFDAIEAMKDLNTTLPLIVFDNLEWLKILEITTIAQPIEEIYTQIADNMISKLNTNKHSVQKKARNIRIKPKLVIRKSA